MQAILNHKKALQVGDILEAHLHWDLKPNEFRPIVVIGTVRLINTLYTNPVFIFIDTEDGLYEIKSNQYDIRKIGFDPKYSFEV